jgi:hypothetical protein
MAAKGTRTAQKGASKKGASKKGAAKKGAARKNVSAKSESEGSRTGITLFDIDPPIVVTGGGGNQFGRGSRIRIRYRDTNNIPKERTPRHPTSKDISHVVVTHKTVQGGVSTSVPYTLMNGDSYEIEVIFHHVDRRDTAKRKTSKGAGAKGSKSTARKRR